MATLNDIITEVDEIKPNQYDDDLKIMWLSNLDLRIKEDLYKTHHLSEDEQTMIESFIGYTQYDMSATLLAPEPYSELYRYYLMAQIDLYNNESDRYANSMIMFNNAYQEYSNHFNRDHTPLSLHLML